MTGRESLELLKKDIKEVLEKYCPNHPETKLLTFELMSLTAWHMGVLATEMAKGLPEMLVGLEVYSQSTSKPQEGV